MNKFFVETEFNSTHSLKKIIPGVFILLTLLLCFFSSCHNSDIAPQKKPLTWTELEAPYFGTVVDVRFTSQDTGYILASDSSFNPSIVKTVDGGKTWERLYFPITRDGVGPVQQLEVSPFNSKILFSFAYDRLNQILVIRSHDGGRTWQPTDTTYNLLWGRYHFASPTKIIRAGESINNSIDSGFTWTKIYEIPDGNFASYRHLKFTSSSKGYAAGGIYFDVVNYGLMAKTTDGGNSWQPIDFPFHNIRGMSFVNDNVGYILMQMDSGTINQTLKGGNDLFKTTDGGDTWHAVKKNMFSNLDYSDGRDLTFINDKDGYALGGTNVYRTADGGLTWDLDSPNEIVTNLCFAGNSCCYAIDIRGRIFKRTF